MHARPIFLISLSLLTRELLYTHTHTHTIISAGVLSRGPRLPAGDEGGLDAERVAAAGGLQPHPQGGGGRRGLGRELHLRAAERRRLGGQGRRGQRGGPRGAEVRQEAAQDIRYGERKGGGNHHPTGLFELTGVTNSALNM